LWEIREFEFTVVGIEISSCEMPVAEDAAAKVENGDSFCLLGEHLKSDTVQSVDLQTSAANGDDGFGQVDFF
jgi:hypothetical protein